ncbi:MAG: hypothetical protein HY372_02820 [Candidatus Andersenbacteria bacterium]|nr:hypothetical protein [Candidatus Andersenbacteria bacterium]
MLQLLDFSPPDSIFPGTTRVMSVLVIVLGGLTLAAMPLGIFPYRGWPFCLVLLAGGWLGWRLSTEVLEVSLWCERRFAQELQQARAESVILANPREREMFVAKWFIRICKAEDQIKREYAERVEFRSWTQYLARRASQGGDEILAWYHRPIQMLAAAKSIDATLTFAEYEQAKARESLRLANITLLGEEELALAREQLRSQHEPQLPWEKIL